MMIALTRDTRNADGTFGMLSVGGLKLHTCEDDWLENVRGKSCIPAGNYKLVRGHFPKHGETFEVTGVPGRSSILIHAGNTEEDTEGCILLGLRRDYLEVRDEDNPAHPMVRKMAVVESRIAFAKFMAAMTGVDAASIEVIWAAGLPTTAGETWAKS